MISIQNILKGVNMDNFPLELYTVIEKVWGWEVVISNENEYCCKLLVVKKGSTSSTHYHKQKKETFICMNGWIKFTYEVPALIPHALTKTMRKGDMHCLTPRTAHSYHGLTDAVILEISTHHSDDDVVRLSQSMAGVNA